MASVADPPGPKERKPKCARCRNHNVLNELKGHKRHCIFQNCQCPKCSITRLRQKVVAKEVARHREHLEEEARGATCAPFPGTSRQPKCSKCRNHYVSAPLKGHRHQCPFKNCFCMKCLLVNDRKEIEKAFGQAQQGKQPQHMLTQSRPLNSQAYIASPCTSHIARNPYNMPGFLPPSHSASAQPMGTGRPLTTEGISPLAEIPHSQANMPYMLQRNTSYFTRNQYGNPCRYPPGYPKVDLFRPNWSSAVQHIHGLARMPPPPVHPPVPNIFYMPPQNTCHFNQVTQPGQS